MMKDSLCRAFLSMVLAAGTFHPIGTLSAQSTAQPSAYEQVQSFSGVLNQIRNTYVDSVQLGGLVRAAIEGMLESLDPFSRYVTVKEFEARMAFDNGQLAGAGLALDYADGSVVVRSVASGGPAFRAGLQPGDRVRSIDSRPVLGLPVNDVELRLLGPKGSKVQITLERGPRADPDTFAVSIKRTPIDSRMVSEPRLAAPGTGYISLFEFTPPSPGELRDAIRKVKGMGARNLILDLRGNGGGSLAAMVEIAGMFLPAKAEIFRSHGRTRMARDTVVAGTAGEFVDLPLVLLIDGGSASASEILAGALQDHDRALIVGRPSFGKALSQVAFPLPGGDVVWLTVGRIASPSGRIIQRPFGPRQERFASEPAPAPDSTAAFRTGKGRIVRGGGGIAPDVVRATPPFPSWFSVAADSGLILSAADSIASLYPAPGTGPGSFATDSAGWDAQLVGPFLTLVQARMKVRADASSALRARLGRVLAHRVAERRWGTEQAEDFLFRTDRDIQAAVASVPRMRELLRQ